MDSLAQDTLLGDRYRLARRIAIGGMGEVWRAEDTVLHRTVAVKVLKSELTQDQTFLERFRTEARTTASLQHTGIASVFDYGEVRRRPTSIPVAYLVMEFVDGEPLSAMLARDGRLPPVRVLDIVGQAALALPRRTAPGWCTATSSRATCWSAVGRRGEDHRLRHRPGRRRGAADPERDGGRHRAVLLARAGRGPAWSVRPATSTRSAWSRTSAWPGGCRSSPTSPVTVAMMQIRDVPPPLPPDVPRAGAALVMRTLAKDPRQRFANGGELAAAVAGGAGGAADAAAVVRRRTRRAGRCPAPRARSGPGGPPGAGGPPGHAVPHPARRRPSRRRAAAPPARRRPGGRPARAARRPPARLAHPGGRQPPGARPQRPEPAAPPPSRRTGDPAGSHQAARPTRAAAGRVRGSPGPRVGPDGVGGTNPALPYPPWSQTGTGWTAPPGDQPAAAAPAARSGSRWSCCWR